MSLVMAHNRAARCLVLLLGAYTAAETIATPAQGQSSEDEAAYVAYGCYECHGYAGQGGNGPLIAPTQIPWEAFERIVRQPPDSMPAYPREQLNNETLQRIYRYVQSVPKPPEAADIPALRDRMTPLP